jgi:two-component system chemotaxis response regulator CheY
VIRTPVFPNVPVLLLDENAFVRRTIRGMLEQANMRQVVEAADVREAIFLLTRMKPGLIVMDWEPRSAALLEMLRDPRRSTQTSLPVIAITSYPTAKMIDAAIGQNVAFVLRKPFGPKHLWQRIARFFAIETPPAGGAPSTAFQI